MGQVRVGTASWTDRTLIESGWYPPEANNPEKRLRYYARQFPLVEVDATYYALPAEQTARAWAERTPPGFTFNIKAFSLFTQHPTPVRAFPADLREAAGSAGKDRVYLKDVDPAVAEAAWDRFLAALGPLRDAGKLGAILLQFPPWFPIGRARREYILACAQRAAPDRVCVEFRNRTWMTEDNQRETLDFLASHQLPYVCVDMPQGYPSSIPPVLAATSDLAVVRMHGHSDKWTSKEISEKYGYKYSDQELDEWAGRVRDLSRAGRGHARAVQQLLPRLGARQRPAAHREACRSLTWRLIRDSIAAMPRSRSGLTRSASPSWLENSGGVASTSPASRPSSPACRMAAKPRVVGASAGASKYRCTFSSGSTSTARNSGVWHSGTGSIRSRCPA